MVELPEYYEKFETDGNKRRAWMSLEPLAGFRKVPKRYVSAYQAYVKDSKLCSIAGVLASSNISRTGFRNAARARKTGSAEWNCHVYDIQRELYWLFAIEYAQLSCQTNYNAALTALVRSVPKLSSSACRFALACAKNRRCGKQRLSGVWCGISPARRST